MLDFPTATRERRPRWRPAPEGVSVEASIAYSAFLPGRFIEETGPNEVVHFVAVELVYRF